MTINLILNLARGYLSLYYNYSKIQLSKLFFQNLIKDVIMFKDILLKNNKLSNKFVTNLQSCKKRKGELVKYVRFVTKTKSCKNKSMYF